MCLFLQFQTHKKQIVIIFESEQSTYYTMNTIYYVVVSHNSFENINHLTKNIGRKYVLCMSSSKWYKCYAVICKYLFHPNHDFIER